MPSIGERVSEFRIGKKVVDCCMAFPRGENSQVMKLHTRRRHDGRAKRHFRHALSVIQSGDMICRRRAQKCADRRSDCGPGKTEREYCHKRTRMQICTIRSSESVGKGSETATGRHELQERSPKAGLWRGQTKRNDGGPTSWDRGYARTAALRAAATLKAPPPRACPQALLDRRLLRVTDPRSDTAPFRQNPDAPESRPPAQPAPTQFTLHTTRTT